MIGSIFGCCSQTEKNYLVNSERYKTRQYELCTIRGKFTKQTLHEQRALQGNSASDDRGKYTKKNMGASVFEEAINTLNLSLWSRKTAC